MSRRLRQVVLVTGFSLLLVLAPIGVVGGTSVGASEHAVDAATATEATTAASAEYTIAGTQTPDVLVAGDRLDASIDVENVGDAEGTTTVGLRLNGGQVATREVTIAPGETRTVAFSVTDTAGLCCSEPGVNETVTWEFRVQGEPGQPTIGRLSTFTAVPGDRTLLIQGSGSYEVATNVDIEPAAGVEADDSISDDGTTVTGTVDGDADEYTIDGNVVSVSVDGTATAAVDGRRIAGETRTLRFSGDGAKSAYRFEVNGTVTGGERLGPADTIGPTSTRGLVFGGRDVYTFTGDLSSVSVVGNATVSLDGEQIDPDDYVETHTLEFVGDDSIEFYSVAVSGELNRVDSLEGRDGPFVSSAVGAKPRSEIGGPQYARGLVTVGTDSFTFTGDLQAFSRFGFDGTVLVDGEPIDPSDYGTIHEITFCPGDGTYEFTVPGEVVAEQQTERYRDGFSGSSGQGFIGGGVDSYYYIGPREPTSVETTGDVEVSVDGEELDPDWTC
jgi:hypothetical protein